MKPTLLVCLVSCIALGQTDLEQARAKYLNQQVVVTQSMFKVATSTADGYTVAATAPYISDSYKGQKATVIAVQPKVVRDSPVKVNVMGEAIKAPPSSEVDFVIKFNDGLIAMRSDSLQTIKSWLLLAEDVAAHEAKESESEEGTKKLIGQQVYATALSELFKEDATDFSDRMRTRAFPHLVPMTILAAKWDKERSCAIVKLAAQGGEYFIGLLSLHPFGVTNEEIGCKRSVGLWRDIPSFLKPKEVSAIRSSAVAIGMSTSALYFSIGFPDRENDYGRGGKQLIYKDGLFVYTDLNGTVTNWQHISR
jgi:hypothetical protein